MTAQIIIDAQLAQYYEQLEVLQQQAIYIAGAIEALEETKAQLGQAAAAAESPADPVAQ